MTPNLFNFIIKKEINGALIRLWVSVSESYVSGILYGIVINIPVIKNSYNSLIKRSGKF